MTELDDQVARLEDRSTRAARLAARFADPAPAPKPKFEERSVRWNVWVDRQLRARVIALAERDGTTHRQALDKVIAAGLDALDHRP